MKRALPCNLSLSLSVPLSVSQDTVLTLEAITEYSRIAPRAVLNQEINIRYRRKGLLDRVQLTKSLPMASRQVRVRQVDHSETSDSGQ